MSELDILELEAEHAEQLPEREALGGMHYYSYPSTSLTQVALAEVSVSQAAKNTVLAAAANYAL